MAGHGTEKNPVILVRAETSPEDIEGMVSAAGILTSRGGMTSHAAVVTRGMGKSCVAGAQEIDVDEKKREIRVKGQVFKEGDWISLDGSTGRVIKGKVKTVPPDPKDLVLLDKFMSWVEPFRTMKVRANADIPRDALNARKFRGEGIGLCRTEHMFFGEEKIAHMRAMILADNEKDRRNALKKLLPMQRKDFDGVFRAMNGFPVTIRTLDPPLHEFLPPREELMVNLAILPYADAKQKKSLVSKYRDYGVKAANDLRKVLSLLLKRVEQLHEVNPMLGHRGCRLGITYPEITEMQARAIFELPRAALVAGEIAKEAQFFSFGTNDLTQTTWGFSRDDVNKILPTYLAEGIIKQDPFAVLDREGVGQLLKMATERGRKTNPNLKVGICGEHGGEPSSVEFCYQTGLNYVSCSPFRVLTARLAAAQAAAGEKMQGAAGRTR